MFTTSSQPKPRKVAKWRRKSWKNLGPAGGCTPATPPSSWGLVDELGSLEDAIAFAIKQAGLKPEDKVERLTLPKPVSPLESLLGPLDPNADAQLADPAVRRVLHSLSPELERNFQALHLLQSMSRERIMTVMPFRLLVK
jgi:protease-4